MLRNGGREEAQEGGLSSTLRDSDIPLRLRESLKWIRKHFSSFLNNIDPRDFGVAVSQEGKGEYNFIILDIYSRARATLPP